MFSFESPKQTGSGETLPDSPKENIDTISEKDEDLFRLSAQIDQFVEKTPEISDEDLEKLTQIKERFEGICKKAGKVLRAGLLSSSILLAGVQNAVAEEPDHNETSSQTKTEQVEKSELEKRIQNFKEGLSQDVTERLAIYYDGVEVINKQSEHDDMVTLSKSELDALPNSAGLESRTVLHTHPIETAYAPSSVDIHSLFASHLSHMESTNKSVVIDSKGTWHLELDASHPTTQKYELLPEVYVELRQNVPELILEVLASENREALMQQKEVAAAFEAFATTSEKRIAEALGEDIQKMLASIEDSRYEISHAEDDDSYETAVEGYLDILNNLGIVARYEANNGTVYEQN